MVAAATAAATAALLAFLGFWDRDSPRYWRGPAQATLLFAAHHMPSAWVARTARLALRVHTDGASYAELEQAALFFEKAGEAAAASTLHLALAGLDATSQNHRRAVFHAGRSDALAPSRDALLSLIVLERHSADAKASLVAKLQSRHPEHEFATTFKCLADVRSFNAELPDSCIGWVRERATADRKRYVTLSRQIQNLPLETARQISSSHRAIAVLEKEQASLRSRQQSLNAQIAWFEKNGNWRATGKAVREMLPLPRSGDTVETWLVREVSCLLPVVRWLCRAGDVAKGFADVDEEKRQLAQERGQIASLLSGNESRLASHRETIRYWRGSAPMEKLTSARNALIHSFRRDVEETLFSRISQIGLRPTDAIADAIKPTRDETEVALLCWISPPRQKWLMGRKKSGSRTYGVNNQK